jgi:hypothetical protein
MAKWPRARESHPPVEVEFDLEGTCYKYPGSPGVGFVEDHSFYPRSSHWPIRRVPIGGHHTWYVGGQEPEDAVDPGVANPNYGRGDRLDE